MAEENLIGSVSDALAKKVERVLGIAPEDLAACKVDYVIEELCDTALMFDQESKGKSSS